jgi:serine/threonine protein kinase
MFFLCIAEIKCYNKIFKFQIVCRSLGITALEMAEGKAPYGDIHPMRAIFMIPSKPPPSFSEPDKWSAAFIDFVSRCLVKNPGKFSLG